VNRRRDLGLSHGLRTFPMANYRIDDEDAAMLHVIQGSRDIESFFHH